MAETSVHDAIPLKSSGDCPSCTTRDLISDLPDTVIHHVFSFLPLRDVVRTSVLSKRWRSTWTATTDLVFNELLGRLPGSTFDRSCSILDMSYFVESILSQYNSATVKRFHVTGFKAYDETSPSVDLWLHFAVQHRVEYLRLRPHERSSFLYILLESLCCLSSLVCLEVAQCRFPLGVTIRWPCLKVLSIDNVKLSDDTLGKIFRGSPVLETLKLCGCRGLKNVIIDSLSLKELVLMGLTMNYTTVETVWAPYLLTLRVSGRNKYEFRLDDVSSLVEAELDFYITIDKSYSKCRGFLKELLKKLCRVPTITISGWCLMVLSLLEMDKVASPLSKCRNLIISASVEQEHLPGIAYMLRSSQCLEKLVVCLIHIPAIYSLPMFGCDREFRKIYKVDAKEFLRSRKGDFECLAKHLSRVEIISFEDIRWDPTHLLILIEFLLGGALVLEKLIIQPEPPSQHVPKRIPASEQWKLSGLAERVLSYPRASRNAEVIYI